MEGRARLDWNVQVPICDLRLQIPYAYQNGVWNLVKPHRFSAQEGPALGAAMRLAIEGDLLKKHGQDSEGEKHLIVIPAFEKKEVNQHLERKVEQVLQEYDVDTVSENRIADFAAHVQQTAH